MKWRNPIPWVEGVLAPRRWPHELEKPHPRLRLSRLADVPDHSAFSLNLLARASILCRASASAALLFRRSLVRRLAPLFGVPSRRLTRTPLLDLMDYHTPTFYGWVVLWYYTAPFVTVMLAGFLLMSVWKVWFESRRKRGFRRLRRASDLAAFSRPKRLRES